MFIKRLFENLSNLIFFAIFLILLPDVYGSSETIFKHFGIPSYIVAIIILSLFIFIRIKYNQFIDIRLRKVNNLIIFPVLLISSIFLVLLDQLKDDPNFVFSLTSLQSTQIYFMALFSGVVSFVEKPNSWFRANYLKAIFLGAPIAFLSAWVMVMFPFDKFIHLSQEDEFFETIQLVFLIFAIFISYRISKSFYKKKEKINGLIFAVFTFGILILIGEEISWGQRIFGIATPDVLIEHNVQYEVSIHNLYIFDSKIDMAYFFVSMYGLFGAFIGKIIPSVKKNLLKYYLPTKYTTSYFFISFIFYLYNGINPRYGYWDEFMELIVYAGVAFALLIIYLRQIRYPDPRLKD